jgi:hypothetical protein
VLHHLPTPATLTARVRRGSQEVEKTLTLAGDWRRTDVSWRDALNGLRPGISSRPVSQGERTQNNISDGNMALGVRYVFSDSARQSGIRQGEIITAVDGLTNLAGEGDLLSYLRLTKAGASSAQLTVKRRGEERTITLPLK